MAWQLMMSYDRAILAAQAIDAATKRHMRQLETVWLSRRR